MKKKLLVIALLVMAASILTVGTLAFFNAETSVDNVVTMGKIDVTIVETQLAEDGVSEVPYVNNKDIMPGETVSKIVRVANADGANDAWVRAKITVSAGENLTLSDSQYELALGEGWEKGTDGYYYCKAKLEVGGKTAPLMTGIEFIGEEIGNDYQGATFTVTIDAEAVQFANNGATALEAKGWPEEQQN